MILSQKAKILRSQWEWGAAPGSETNGHWLEQIHIRIPVLVLIIKSGSNISNSISHKQSNDASFSEDFRSIVKGGQMQCIEEREL